MYSPPELTSWVIYSSLFRQITFDTNKQNQKANDVERQTSKIVVFSDLILSALCGNPAVSHTSSDSMWKKVDQRNRKWSTVEASGSKM